MNPEKIQRVAQRCGCIRSVHRITHPVVSSWIARFSGDVVATDVIRPFVDHGPEGLSTQWKAIGEISALLVVDSLTRFVSFRILKNANSEATSQVFANDWAKRFGKQKRIILDRGGTGLVGWEWGTLSHIVGRQYIRAPVRESHQNGLADRTVRSLKAAVRSIVRNDQYSQPSQALLTLAAIAENHAPRAVAGLPPAFATTGRFGVRR